MLTKRETTIADILNRWDELVERAGRSGVRGDDDTVSLMPRSYNASVREVERLMRRMKVERPSQWWHVSERYLRSQRSSKTVLWWQGRWQLPAHHEVVAQPGGWTLELARGKKRRAPQEFRVAVVSWSPAVRAQKVRLGLAWLAGEWSLGHEPMLFVEKGDKVAA